MATTVANDPVFAVDPSNRGMVLHSLRVALLCDPDSAAAGGLDFLAGAD